MHHPCDERALIVRLYSLLILGWMSTPVAAWADGPGHVLRGIVLVGGESAPGVTVELVGLGVRRVAETDAEGRFAFSGLSAGRLVLRVEDPDLGRARETVDVPTDAPVTLELTPAPQAPDAVTVRGRSVADRMRATAEAVEVVSTEDARHQSADLGEVLARSSGIGVRRSGGLGANTRLSLNGLTDDQVRVFVDGLPIHLAGYPFGFANVPVNLVDRVEIYRGVVPIRFAADALGGAINIVTAERLAGDRAAVSVQLGSFGTARTTAVGQLHHSPTGLVLRVSAFFDRAENDYSIDVEVPDARGRLVDARVRRFHDGYRAFGGRIEAGVVDRPWARQLVLRAFATRHTRDLQHNVIMTIPYGEVVTAGQSLGANMRYTNGFGAHWSLDAVAGTAYGHSSLEDRAICLYDWRGDCVLERRQPGEINGAPIDRVVWDHTWFARAELSFETERHAARLAVGPSVTTRSGDNRLAPDDGEIPDPLTAERHLRDLVAGLEYTHWFWDDRVEHAVFVKGYAQRAESFEPQIGGALEARDRDTWRFGVGDTWRVRLAESLTLKASYEWATRLPRVDEVFGDGVQIVDNPDLVPETSHNANLGGRVERESGIGRWTVDCTGFLRAADDLILLLGNDRVFSYQNVFAARATGIEASVGWTSPARWFAVEGNATWLDFRNTSSEGVFADFEGDRIPNRPHRFANAAAHVRVPDLTTAGDVATVDWNMRYVGAFFRSWESAGLREFKQSIPAQWVHTVGVGWRVPPPWGVALSAEVQNVFGAQAFDFFGVQRPGRAVFFKTELVFDAAASGG